MFFNNVLSFLFAFVTCASVVHAAPRLGDPTLTTNAKRFSRGLPPLAPPSMKKRTPTKVDSAKRNYPSNSANTFTGKIKVRKTNGDLVGYLSEDLNNGGYTVTSQSSHAVHVSFDAAASGVTSQMNIKDTSNNRMFTPNIGGAGASNLASGSGNFVVVAGVAPVPAGSSALSVSPLWRTTLTGDIESAFWKFDASNSRISAQWVNTDHSTPTTLIYYNPSSGGTVVLVGDGTAYHNSHSSAYQVILTLV